MYDNITTSYSRHTLERLQESHSQIQPWTIVVSSYKYMSDRSGRIGGHERMGRALAHNSRFEKWTVVFTELGPAHNNLFTWKSSLQMVLRGEAVRGIALASKERLSSRGTSPRESHPPIQPWTIVVSSYMYMSDRSGRIGGHERMGRPLAHNSSFDKWTVVFSELGPAHNNLFTWKSYLQMFLRRDAMQSIALASKEGLYTRGTSLRVPFARHVLEDMRHWLNGHGDAENIWITRSTIQQFFLTIG